MTKENNFNVEQHYEEMADALENILFNISSFLNCDKEILDSGLARDDWDDVLISSKQIMEFAHAQNCLRNFTQWKESKLKIENQVVVNLKKEFVN